MENEKIKNFTNLIAWQEAHTLCIEVYQNTKAFPKEEIYGIVSQIRRVAVSVASNIAEGFGRRTAQYKTRFFYMARGSLTELHNQVLLAKDIGYLEDEVCKKWIKRIEQTSKLINGLIKKLKEF